MVLVHSLEDLLSLQFVERERLTLTDEEEDGSEAEKLYAVFYLLDPAVMAVLWRKKTAGWERKVYRQNTSLRD